MKPRCLPAEPEEYLMLLADRKLLELPLESLSVLQGQGPVPVTRDFSLQIFYNRLNREEQKGTKHLISSGFIICQNYSKPFYINYYYFIFNVS